MFVLKFNNIERFSKNKLSNLLNLQSNSDASHYTSLLIHFCNRKAGQRSMAHAKIKARTHLYSGDTS